jgi:hypothetical protein
MVGLVIHQFGTGRKDKSIGFSFRRRDQSLPEVIWRLFKKVAQSNSRFNAVGPLSITIHYVKMPIGLGKKCSKPKVGPLNDLVHLKRNTVHVDAETNCLPHALIIAIARVDTRITIHIRKVR